MRPSLLLLLLLGCHAQGQRVRFIPMIDGAPLVPGKTCVLKDGTSVTISTFRYYVGQFTGWHDHTPRSFALPYQLVDLEDSTSWSVDLGQAMTFDSLTFMLGVDSLTNVSGVMPNDLDPIKGMYWTWNSGYINVKLEGSSPVSPYASHQFELHLGGYLPPHTTAQRVVLCAPRKDLVRVRVDVAPLLAAADLRTRCNILQPGARAVALSRAAATMFSKDDRP